MHIDPNALQEDILYELLLTDGFPLTTSIEKRHMPDKNVFARRTQIVLLTV